MNHSILGLRYIPEFISEEEEKTLLDAIDDSDWSNVLKRRVQHYGYEYSYKQRTVTSDMYIGPVPNYFQTVLNKLLDANVFASYPNQVIVNEYNAGQGIASHVDNPNIFGDTVVSLSLGAAYPMVFTNPNTGEKIERILESRSLLILQGDARYIWKHGIVSRKADVIDGNRVTRGRRVSVTMRSIVPFNNNR